MTTTTTNEAAATATTTATNAATSTFKGDEGCSDNPSKFKGAVKRLEAIIRGERAPVCLRMGSCQCGDVEGEAYLNDGEIVVEVHGLEEWQCYAGLARDCQVGYGLGRDMRQLAAIFEASKRVSGDKALALRLAPYLGFVEASYAVGSNPLPHLRRAAPDCEFKYISLGRYGRKVKISREGEQATFSF